MVIVPDEILVQKKQCETAHKELQEEDMKFSLAQIEFLCAYITHMMQPYLEVDELHKLHHNTKIWTVNVAPPFTPVNLRSNHLTKEDLKHHGCNVGKFLRLQGGVVLSPDLLRKCLRNLLKAPMFAPSNRDCVKVNRQRKECQYTRQTRWISCLPTSNAMATSTPTYSIEPKHTQSQCKSE